MAFEDKICISDSPVTAKAWVEQFERNSGYTWPPTTATEWSVILTRAGFSEQRINDFLAGTLPDNYVSADGGKWLSFSHRLIAGLERWKATEGGQGPAYNDERWMTVSEVSSASGIDRQRINEAATQGQFVTNGKPHHGRRIDRISFLDWQLALK